jgi:exodeoxyribonuclease V beta subunit
LPVVERKPGTARAREHAVDASRLARVFREHPSPELPASYADALGTLDFVPLVGFLRGYIDLVVMHEGRYFVFDYKTNHLGDTALDYGPAGLAEGMRHGHYFLQYHLYTLAVHRYLARRLRSYGYDEHFGGSYYLFIKGMHPELGASGVFFEKPPMARLQALSDLLELSWT